MALLNQIGPNYFLSLDGGVETIKPENELLRRPGVPGVGLLLTGIRGRDFTDRSRVDAATVQAAEDMYVDYTNLIGTLQPVAQYGKEFTDYGYGFLVRDVRKLELRALSLFVGGLNPPSFGWLVCEWTLVCVALDQLATQ